MELEVVNIVATAKLSTPLEFSKLMTNLKNIGPSLGGGKWLKMRLAPENHYIAFYKSGKFLITGAKSLEVVKEIAERVLEILKGAGFDLYLVEIIIHNVVMVGRLNLNIGLEKILHALDNSDASYEPEQFPGLFYRGFGAHFLLFPSGKIIVTGMKDFNTGFLSAAKFEEMLQEISKNS